MSSKSQPLLSSTADWRRRLRSRRKQGKIRMSIISRGLLADALPRMSSCHQGSTSQRIFPFWPLGQRQISRWRNRNLSLTTTRTFCGDGTGNPFATCRPSSGRSYEARQHQNGALWAYRRTKISSEIFYSNGKPLLSLSPPKQALLRQLRFPSCGRELSSAGPPDRALMVQHRNSH